MASILFSILRNIASTKVADVSKTYYYKDPKLDITSASRISQDRVSTMILLLFEGH
jgi:hypothetical protein